MTAGDDGYFMDGVGIFFQILDDSVARLVIGRCDFVLFVDDGRFAGASPADFVAGLFEVVLFDKFLAGEGGAEGGFVDGGQKMRLQQEGWRFLGKPFLLPELLSTVHLMLEPCEAERMRVS